MAKREVDNMNRKIKNEKHGRLIEKVDFAIDIIWK